MMSSWETTTGLFALALIWGAALMVSVVVSLTWYAAKTFVARRRR